MQTDIGMWVYNSELFNPYRVTPAAWEVVSWAKSKKVRRLYLNFSTLASSDPTWKQWALDIKNSLGSEYKVFACFGSPSWAEPSGHSVANTWVSSVLALKDSNNRRIFDGVMLDVEPTWSAAPTQANMQSLHDMQQLLMSAAHSAPFDAAKEFVAECWFFHPCWWSQFTWIGAPYGTVRFDYVLLYNSDGIAFGTYRNTVANIQLFAEQMADAGQIMGKPVRFTVEAADSGVPGCDYHDSTRAIMESHMAQVMANVWPTRRLASGIDVHSMGAWKALP